MNAVKISDLVFKPNKRAVGGSVATYQFPNGYTASVITGSGACGNAEKPYDIAVIHNDMLCYDTPITDDVVGYLTEEEANDILQQIASLPERV